MSGDPSVVVLGTQKEIATWKPVDSGARSRGRATPWARKGLLDETNAEYPGPKGARREERRRKCETLVVVGYRVQMF